jgi:hypothetical protein
MLLSVLRICEVRKRIDAKLKRAAFYLIERAEHAKSESTAQQAGNIVTF